MLLAQLRVERSTAGTAELDSAALMTAVSHLSMWREKSAARGRQEGCWSWPSNY